MRFCLKDLSFPSSPAKTDRFVEICDAPECGPDYRPRMSITVSKEQASMFREDAVALAHAILAWTEKAGVK